MIELIWLLSVVVMALPQQEPTPTPDPAAEAQALQDEAQALIDEAMTQQPPLTTDGQGQIFDDQGAPLLPSTGNITIAFSYIKFFYAPSTARAVFGPFAPVVSHLRFFISLALLWLLFYFVQAFISVLIRFALFIARNIQVLLILIIVGAILLIIYWLANFFT